MFGIKRRLQRRRPNVRQVQRVLRTSASNLGTPIENVRFLLLTINLAREWLQIDTDLLRVSQQALLTSFPGVPTSMTLKHLEPPKYGF